MATHKPALLVLTSTYPRWAGDTVPPFVHDLCRELARDFDVHVLAPHTAGAAVTEILAGVTVHRYRYLPQALETLAYEGGIPAQLGRKPLRLLQVPFFVLGQLLAALRLAWTLRPVVIHAHWIIPQGLAAVLVRCLAPGHAKVVCTAHGADLFSLRSLPLRVLKRLVVTRSDHVTVVSEAMLEPVRRLGASAVSVAPMGVDVESIFRPDAGQTRDPASIVFVGRLVEKKGARLLVQAFAQVREQVAGARLHIIGDGPELPRLRDDVGAAGLSGEVEFHGAMHQSAIAGQLRRATVAAFPFMVAADGDREGLGLTLVEAQACECPVIAFDTAALRDTVKPGISGLIVDAGDTAGLAAAIVSVLADATLARRLGVNARKAVCARFAVDVCARRYRELFCGLCSS